MENGSSRHIGMAAAALAWLASACSHVGAGAGVTQEELTAPRSTDQQHEKVLVTGSRIPQRIDASTGLPATASPVRIYSRRDLQGTGRPETADALRQLDPSLR